MWIKVNLVEIKKEKLLGQSSSRNATNITLRDQPYRVVLSLRSHQTWKPSVTSVTWLWGSQTVTVMTRYRRKNWACFFLWRSQDEFKKSRLMWRKEKQKEKPKKMLKSNKRKNLMTEALLTVAQDVAGFCDLSEQWNTLKCPWHNLSECLRRQGALP